MKRTKSIVALVLAVVLVFALSASAFATDSVSVTIMMQGYQAYPTTNVSTNDIATYKAQLRTAYLAALDDPSSPLYGETDDGSFTYHLYRIAATDPSGDPGVPTYPTTYTAADVLIAAWIKVNNYTSATSADGEYDYVWYNNTVNNTTVFGLYFYLYGGLPSDDGDYYLEETDYSGPDPVYTYVWAGYSWDVSVDNAHAGYLSEYAMSDIGAIVVDYTWVVSEDIVTTDYYSFALPGPAPRVDPNL